MAGACERSAQGRQYFLGRRGICLFLGELKRAQVAEETAGTAACVQGTTERAELPGPPPGGRGVGVHVARSQLREHTLRELGGERLRTAQRCGKARACLLQACIPLDTHIGSRHHCCPREVQCLARRPELRSESAAELAGLSGALRGGLQGREVVENSGLSRAGRG